MTKPRPEDDEQDTSNSGQDDGSQGYDSETSVRKGQDPEQTEKR